ncbi:MAG: YHS domain-containing (seleno)protein [Gammaproteobacteria bacterium]|nr:YHS domain-containing (seleno)protein [Gammaproteobacteria bacterium]
MISRLLFTLVLLAGSVALSHAGPQYVDESGYAAGGYDVVAYHSLEQAPVGEPQPEAVPGRASITAEYNGATWAFATEENQEKFLADPERYAPRFDGHCAYGVAQGGKVPGNPNLWRIVDGELYLNITPNVVGFFEEDIPGHLAAAEENWNKLVAEAVSTRSWKAIDANAGTWSIEAPLDE